jgi:5-methylcytosine-specific restriction endonuclease McrA
MNTSQSCALYGTRRWRGDDKGRGGLRWRVLLDATFACQMCGAMHIDTSKLVADHIVPHRGSATLFWDRDNLWCVCKECHDTTCQEIEAQHAMTDDEIRQAKLSRSHLSS